MKRVIAIGRVFVVITSAFIVLALSSGAEAQGVLGPAEFQQRIFLQKAAPTKLAAAKRKDCSHTCGPLVAACYNGRPYSQKVKQECDKMLRDCQRMNREGRLNC